MAHHGAKGSSDYLHRYQLFPGQISEQLSRSVASSSLEKKRKKK
jgi:hypothetical protein